MAFKAYCQLLSPGPEYRARPFQLLFFHLRSSGFWHLRDVVAYASAGGSCGAATGAAGRLLSSNAALLPAASWAKEAA